MNRQPILHGQFYEADPQRLRAQVEAFLTLPPAPLPSSMLPLAENAPRPDAPVRAVMLPHAGHVYCGSVIGRTLARCRLPARLFLLCPNHTGPGAPLAVWPDGAWRTPLGDVPVDAPLADALLNSGGGFSADTDAHAGEHSLEVLLPFLQVHSPQSRIVPIRVSCPPDALHGAATALARVIHAARVAGEDVGLVISSDMNHYATEAETHRLDALALAPLLRLDPAGLFNTVHRERISMCGVYPATLALLALTALADTPIASLAAYDTSATAFGDASRAVGYAGVIIQ